MTVNPVNDVNNPPLQISGVDKRSFIVLFALFALWGVIAIGALAVLKVRLTDTVVGVMGGTLVVCLGLPTAAAAGAFKAQLIVDGEKLRLRWLFGLASREVGFPAEIETGTAIDSEMKSTGMSAVDGGARDVKLGAYLRLSNGRRAITLAAKEAPELSHHWAPGGWTRGKERRSWDITVDASGLAAIESQLALRGQLTLRDVRDR